MPKGDEGLGLIDVMTHGSIQVTKCVAWCLEGPFPSQVILRHRFLLAHHIGKVKGDFGLCDIILAPHSFQIVGSFIFRSI